MSAHVTAEETLQIGEPDRRSQAGFLFRKHTRQANEAAETDKTPLPILAITKPVLKISEMCVSCSIATW